MRLERHLEPFSLLPSLPSEISAQVLYDLVVVNVSNYPCRGIERIKLIDIADGALAAALTAEHKYELEENSAHPDTPEFLETFRSQGTWEIKDATGVDDVSLIRQFGSET